MSVTLIPRFLHTWQHLIWNTNWHLPSFCFLCQLHLVIPSFLYTWQHLICNTNRYQPTFCFLCQLYLDLAFFTPDNTWSVTLPDTYHHSVSYVSYTSFLHTWQHLICNTNRYQPSFCFLCQLYLAFFTPDDAWSVTDIYHHSVSYVSYTSFLHTWWHLICNTNRYLPSFCFLC